MQTKGFVLAQALTCAEQIMASGARLTVNSQSYRDGGPSGSVLSDDRPLSRVLRHRWDDDQGLGTVLFNHYLVGVVIDHLLSFKREKKTVLQSGRGLE